MWCLPAVSGGSPRDAMLQSFSIALFLDGVDRRISPWFLIHMSMNDIDIHMFKYVLKLQNIIDDDADADDGGDDDADYYY